MISMQMSIKTLKKIHTERKKKKITRQVLNSAVDDYVDDRWKGKNIIKKRE